MADLTASGSQSSIWWVFLLEGIASIIFGFLLITQPASTLVALAIFLGFYWLFVGVLELARVFVDRRVPWYWSLLIGVLGIIAGLIVLRHPIFSAVVLPAAIVVWLGVLGVVIGIAAVTATFAVILGTISGLVLARFGRFPHRNTALGRESTPEELAFLESANIGSEFLASRSGALGFVSSQDESANGFASMKERPALVFSVR